MRDLKSSMRVGGTRTAVAEDRAEEFIQGVAREGGSLPAPAAVVTAPALAVPAAAPAPTGKTREIHVRIPMSLHKQLQYAAIDRGLSLTQLAAKALEVGLHHLEPIDD